MRGQYLHLSFKLDQDNEKLLTHSPVPGICVQLAFLEAYLSPF